MAGGGGGGGGECVLGLASCMCHPLDQHLLFLSLRFVLCEGEDNMSLTPPQGYEPGSGRKSVINNIHHCSNSDNIGVLKLCGELGLALQSLPSSRPHGTQRGLLYR